MPARWPTSRTALAIAIVALLLSLVGDGILAGIFASNDANANQRIVALESSDVAFQTAIAALQVQLTTLAMRTPNITTTYMQQGTCSLGFNKVAGSSVQTLADFSDYVDITYTLQEVQLNPGLAPFVTLQLGATPRPIVFNGFTPPNTLPRYNDLSMQLALCDPPITQLDTISQSSIALIPYSYTTAATIAISPNCVSNTLQDNAHCRPESAFSPFFSASVTSTNGVSVFTNNIAMPGQAILQFFWGQWSYASIPAQYDFTGTTVSFTDQIELLLLSL